MHAKKDATYFKHSSNFYAQILLDAMFKFLHLSNGSTETNKISLQLKVKVLVLGVRQTISLLQSINICPTQSFQIPIVWIGQCTSNHHPQQPTTPHLLSSVNVINYPGSTLMCLVDFVFPWLWWCPMSFFSFAFIAGKLLHLPTLLGLRILQWGHTDCPICFYMSFLCFSEALQLLVRTSVYGTKFAFGCVHLHLIYAQSKQQVSHCCIV